MSKELIRPDQFARVKNPSILEATELELNPEQQKELRELLEGTSTDFQAGKLVQGTVVKVDSDGVLVDIQYKSHGLIPRYEFNEHEIKKLETGSPIEVIFEQLENVDGNIVLSYEKAKELKAWTEIMKLYEAEQPVEGIVTHKVKGGLSVDIGIPAFLPGSQIDLQRVTDFDKFVGQKVTAMIIKVNKKRGNVIISRRKYLHDQRSEARKEILDTLEVGQVIQGQVKNITNYGVFIDIGGVDGLLHITDMTWGRIAHPSELVRIGDTISVKVLSFDKEHEKISLGLKQLTDNPWADVEEKFKVGSTVKGKISSITDYGLFVEIKKGVEGLVHISEISWTDRINNLASKFKPGQEIDVLIVSLDTENRRMSLSIKQLDKNPWENINQEFKIGDKVKGEISNITDFGVFVQLKPGVDGLVHISDLSWTEHIEHPNDKYARGDEVEAVVLGVDEENKKISLGIKQLTPDPWENIEEEYKVGSVISGEISKITNFGAFVKLETGIEGLVHISELSDKNVDKVEDILKVGETKEFRVINVNKKDRKLGLSLKVDDDSKDQAPQKEAAPKKAAPKKEAKSEAAKPKSQFQMELEKHAARSDEETE